MWMAPSHWLETQTEPKGERELSSSIHLSLCLPNAGTECHLLNHASDPCCTRHLLCHDGPNSSNCEPEESQNKAFFLPIALSGICHRDEKSNQWKEEREGGRQGGTDGGRRVYYQSTSGSDLFCMHESTYISRTHQTQTWNQGLPTFSPLHPPVKAHYLKI